MKLKQFSALFLCATIVFVNCSKDGEDGKSTLVKTSKEASGANCTYGGTKIETGVDANRNGILDEAEVTTTETKYVCDAKGAIYSNWIDINIDTNRSSLISENDFPFRQDLNATAMTADVVDKGIVLMYFKNREGIVSMIDRDDVYEFTDTDLAGVSIAIEATFTFKLNYLALLVRVAEGDKTSINDNGSAVRYVLVPGHNLGRIADLKKMPYSEVAKLYNIKD